jgi:predicted nucleic acid-binding protein
MSGAVLDAGALIAVERGDRRMQALLYEAHRAGARLTVPAGALAQSWRAASRQARLARFLRLDNVAVVPLDEPTAKAAGILCGKARTADIVDASVVIAARLLRQTVITSDPDDLRRLDQQLSVVVV